MCVYNVKLIHVHIIIAKKKNTLRKKNTIYLDFIVERTRFQFKTEENNIVIEVKKREIIVDI